MVKIALYALLVFSLGCMHRQSLGRFVVNVRGDPQGGAIITEKCDVIYVYGWGSSEGFEREKCRDERVAVSP